MMTDVQMLDNCYYTCYKPLNPTEKFVEQQIWRTNSSLFSPLTIAGHSELCQTSVNEDHFIIPSRGITANSHYQTLENHIHTNTRVKFAT